MIKLLIGFVPHFSRFDVYGDMVSLTGNCFVQNISSYDKRIFSIRQTPPRYLQTVLRL